MKKLNRLVAMLVAALMLCATALADPAPAPTDVMATVNGVPVTRQEFNTYLTNMQNYYANNYGYDVTSEDMVTLLSQFALETAVQYVVMDQKVVELGLTLTDAERADAEQAGREDWAELLESGLTYYGITAESTEEERAAMLVTILAELEGMGYTEASYIEDSVTNAAYEKLQAHVIQGVTVTDDAVKAHFDELVAADETAYKNDAASYEYMQQMNMMYLMYGMAEYYTDLYYMPDGYRAVTHILLTPGEEVLKTYSELAATYEEQQNTLEEGGEVTETLVTAEEVEAARLAVLADVQPKIDEINQKLNAGEDFNALIPAYSADEGMLTAEEIAEGYMVHMDSIMWDPAFVQAAFSVNEIGAVAAPVVGIYGVHLVRYDHDVAGGPVELTPDLMEVLRASLLETEQSNTFYNTIDQWVSECEVVYSVEAQAFMTVE